MLRMHDHLKYPYFVAFYENRVKVGLNISAMLLNDSAAQAAARRLDFFFSWLI
jgi:hypothetical protein